MDTRYDTEEDIFTMCDNTAEDYEQSIGNKDHILDLDKKGHVIGIEILNASTHLGLSKTRLTEMIYPWRKKKD